MAEWEFIILILHMLPNLLVVVIVCVHYSSDCWEGVSKPDRAVCSSFFFLLVWVGLGSNPAHHSLTFTYVLPDPHEKVRTIPQLQNPSPGHLLFLHCCKLFFLTSVLITAGIWGCLQPLTLLPFTLSCQLKGCWEVADWLSRIVVLQFSAWKGLCAASVQKIVLRFSGGSISWG